MVEEFDRRQEDRYEQNHRPELEQPLHTCVNYRATAKTPTFVLVLPMKLDAILQLIAVQANQSEAIPQRVLARHPKRGTNGLGSLPSQLRIWQIRHGHWAIADLVG
jgi:hypothetical protein